MKKFKFYNFDLSRYHRRNTEELEKQRKRKIGNELEKLDIDRWWEIEYGDDNVRFLYLTGEEGFADGGCSMPWRSYTVEELEKEAIAIYIASAKRADSYTKLVTPDYFFWKEPIEKEKKQAMQEYLETLRRVYPQGIGIAEVIRIISEIRVKISITEYYEACTIESEVEFVPDLYEVIVVLDSKSELFQREFRNWKDEGEFSFSAAIKRMEIEGRYSETSHTVY